MTNSEKIRAMPDEELAKLIRTRPCNVCAYQYKPCYRYKCEDGILKYLREEAKGDKA